MIEQGENYLGEDTYGNYEAMKKNYDTLKHNFSIKRILNNLSKYENESDAHNIAFQRTIACQFKADIDWYKLFGSNDQKYFSEDKSEIVYILSTDIMGHLTHLFYQPEHKRVIQFFQYG